MNDKNKKSIAIVVIIFVMIAGFFIYKRYKKHIFKTNPPTTVKSVKSSKKSAGKSKKTSTGVDSSNNSDNPSDNSPDSSGDSSGM